MMRFLIAVAAMVLCSASQAESGYKPDIDEDHWDRLGACSGLYTFGDTEADDEGSMRVTKAKDNELEKIQGTENAWVAGFLFGSAAIGKNALFSGLARDGADPKLLESYRQEQLQEIGCQWLR